MILVIIIIMSKRAPSAYNFLTKDKELRSQLLKENPEWSQSDLMVKYGELWRSWTPEQRQKYIDQANEAKQSFVPTNQTRTNNIMRKKRAKTPYFHYLYDEDTRKEIEKNNPGIKQARLTKIAAERWNNLTESQKQPWYLKYEEEKKQLLENPIMIEVKQTNKIDNSSNLENRIAQIEQSIIELTAIIKQLQSNSTL